MSSQLPQVFNLLFDLVQLGCACQCDIGSFEELLVRFWRHGLPLVRLPALEACACLCVVFARRDCEAGPFFYLTMARFRRPTLLGRYRGQRLLLALACLLRLLPQLGLRPGRSHARTLTAEGECPMPSCACGTCIVHASHKLTKVWA